MAGTKTLPRGEIFALFAGGSRLARLLQKSPVLPVVATFLGTAIKEALLPCALRFVGRFRLRASVFTTRAF